MGPSRCVHWRAGPESVEIYTSNLYGVQVKVGGNVFRHPSPISAESPAFAFAVAGQAFYTTMISKKPEKMNGFP